MPDLRVYRTFISHAWSYSDGYNNLVSLLNDANNFVWSNYSVPRAEPVDATSRARLEEALRVQIRPVQVVLIIAGMYAHHSDWIQFEMDFAKSLKKPIIGIRPYGNERVPQAVVSAADEMVNWSTVSIVDAIRRRAM